MRNGFLALLAVLAFDTCVSLAQPAPASPYLPLGAPSGNPEAVLPSGMPMPEPAAVADGPLAQPAAVDSLPELFWFRAEYLMWWTKGGPIPAPLATVGSVNDPLPSVLGQPNTQVLFGGADADYGTTSGMRFSGGFTFDREGDWGVEGGYFLMKQRSVNFGASSDAGGNPVLGVPFVNATTGNENSFAISFPGQETGSIAITSQSRLEGWEANATVNLARGPCSRFDLIAGFRYVSLDDDLQIFTGSTPLQNNGFVLFQNQFVAPPDSVATLDHFGTQNHFSGADVGGRLDWSKGPISVSLTGTVALGDNHQQARIDGSSTLASGGVLTTVPGGVFALASNSNRYSRDEFSVVPEVGIQVSYRINEYLDARVGYSFLYWNNVVRAGDQVDRVLEPALVPTDFTFGNATPGARPSFQFRTTDYWAQGVNFGLQFHY